MRDVRNPIHPAIRSVCVFLGVVIALAAFGSGEMRGHTGVAMFFGGFAFLLGCPALGRRVVRAGDYAAICENEKRFIRASGALMAAAVLLAGGFSAGSILRGPRFGETSVFRNLGSVYPAVFVVGTVMAFFWAYYRGMRKRLEATEPRTTGR